MFKCQKFESHNNYKIEDRRGPKVPKSYEARVVRLGQKHHYYQEKYIVLQTVNFIK